MHIGRERRAIWIEPIEDPLRTIDPDFPLGPEPPHEPAAPTGEPGQPDPLPALPK